MLIIHAQKPGTSEAVCGAHWALLRKAEKATCPECLHILERNRGPDGQAVDVFVNVFSSGGQ